MLAIAMLIACGKNPATPPSGAGTLEGQLVLPPTFTNGTPFTQSTPFTNSIPLVGPTRARRIATTLAGAQVVEAVEPETGRVLAQGRTDADGRFAMTLPARSQPLIVQVVVKDTWGRIFGLVATTTHPSAAGSRLLSAGSTVAPLAGALSVADEARVTFGSGFAGAARPKLARVLAQLDERTTDKAGESYDAQFKDAASGNALMGTVAQSAERLAAQATAGSGAALEEIGTRLGTALHMETDPSTPEPSRSPAPTPTPTRSPRPQPTPWGGDGHAPALPAPWTPRP